MEDENINFTGFIYPLMIMTGYLSLVSTLRDSLRVALVHPHSRDTNLFKPTNNKHLKISDPFSFNYLFVIDHQFNQVLI